MYRMSARQTATWLIGTGFAIEAISASSAFPHADRGATRRMEGISARLRKVLRAGDDLLRARLAGAVAASRPRDSGTAAESVDRGRDHGAADPERGADRPRSRDARHAPPGPHASAGRINRRHERQRRRPADHGLDALSSSSSQLPGAVEARAAA